MKKFYNRKQMLGLALSTAIISNSLVVGNATEIESSEVNKDNIGIDGEFENAELQEDNAIEQFSLQRSVVTKYKVIVDSLNVRKGPGTNHSTLGSLKKGATIEVQSISNGWAKFNFNGKVGYCSANSKYLEKAQVATTTKMQVLVDSLNVRKGPGANHSTLGSLKKGATIEVQSISNGWAKFNFNGKVGYCSANEKYLKKVTSESVKVEVITPSTGGTTNGVTTAKVNTDVNLRKTESWSGTKLLVIKKNSSIEVISKGSAWSKVKYSGKTGYVPNEYIVSVSNVTSSNSSSNSSSSASASTAKVNADVNLRKTESWSGTKLLVIKKNSSIEVISKGSAWSKVKYSGKTGYVPNEYIVSVSNNNTVNPNTGTSSNENINNTTNTVTITEATWLRKTASWSADKMVMLKKDYKAEFISRDNSWIKIKYEGQVGYVSADFVKDVPVVENETKVKKYKVTADSLNVRSGAGTNYDKIGSIKKNQEIDVYSITSGWAKIKYGTKIGYVSADYITEYNKGQTSNSGVGKKVYLDPGHGGTDAGAIGKTYGTKEKDAALDVTKRVASKLRDKGYIVAESRTTDVYPSLSQRSNDANNKGSDIFVSMHFNSATTTAAQGLETLYKVDGRSSNVLADQVQDEMIDATGLRNRGLKQRSDLAVLNRTKMPAILVEGGFLSHSGEENLIRSSSYRETLANAIVKGIEDYFKVM